MVQTKHAPVLLGEVLRCLDPKSGETYLDLTAGYGGHAKAILEQTKGKAVLIDRDPDAVEYLKKEFRGSEVILLQQDFLSASKKLQEENKKFDLILADLGVSSPHLNTASRGFAFSRDGPLDMRMDPSQQLTAETIVNTYSEAELAKLIYECGEEPASRAIARLIVRSRPLKSTMQLADVVARAVRKRFGGRSKVHPATRTFQALRIAVNDELSQVEQALPIWIDLLAADGRLAVISFHSLEDRLVKNAFSEHSIGYEADLNTLTKKPVNAGHEETVSNPRARSARLRAVAKINTKEGSLNANSSKKHFPGV